MNGSRWRGLVCFSLLLFICSSFVLFAQTTSPANETGKFTLHKFEQPIGEENVHYRARWRLAYAEN